MFSCYSFYRYLETHKRKHFTLFMLGNLLMLFVYIVTSILYFTNDYSIYIPLYSLLSLVIFDTLFMVLYKGLNFYYGYVDTSYEEIYDDKIP